jgi:hypothetical protein
LSLSCATSPISSPKKGRSAKERILLIVPELEQRLLYGDLGSHPNGRYWRKADVQGRSTVGEMLRAFIAAPTREAAAPLPAFRPAFAGARPRPLNDA